LSIYHKSSFAIKYSIQNRYERKKALKPLFYKYPTILLSLYFSVLYKHGRRANTETWINYAKFSLINSKTP